MVKPEIAKTTEPKQSTHARGVYELCGGLGEPILHHIYENFPRKYPNFLNWALNGAQLALLHAPTLGSVGDGGEDGCGGGGSSGGDGCGGGRPSEWDGCGCGGGAGTGRAPAEGERGHGGAGVDGGARGSGGGNGEGCDDWHGGGDDGSENGGGGGRLGGGRLARCVALR